MKVVFVRTPRYIWPFNGETSAFWQPLGFMSLAAQLEVVSPDWSVRILDCPGSKMGWKTLVSTLHADWPDVICVGEETVSSTEALRLASTVKQQRPETIVIAGGMYFSHTARRSLETGLIDYIVHGEGEQTLCALLSAIDQGGDVGTVKGLSYQQSGHMISTPARPLIADLDTLPMPAWSKIPMRQYGLGSRNHPGLVSIEHSRGCIDTCSFCILWKHMGQVSEDAQTVRPCFRTKSPERSLDEVMRLVRDYDRFTFGWVDPTWNADPAWTDRFCDLLLKHRVNIRQTAWVRADCIVRDEGLGILEKAVRTGLCQVMIGVERPDESSQKILNKHANGPDITARAVEILNTKYPSVFTIGSAIFGLWNETHRSLNQLSGYCHQIGLDFCFFIPLTPNPGTSVHEDAHEKGLIEVTDHRAFNFHTPVMRTRYFSTRQLEKFYFKLVFGADRHRIVHLLKRLLSVRDARRKRVFRSLLKYGLCIGTRYLWHKLRHPFSHLPATYSHKPAWYEA